MGPFAWLRAKLGTMHGRADTAQGSDVDHVRAVETYVMDSSGNFWCPATTAGLLNAKVLAPVGPPEFIDAGGAGVETPLGDDDYDAFIILSAYNVTAGAETCEWSADDPATIDIADDTTWVGAGWSVPPIVLSGVMLVEAYATFTTGDAGTGVVVQRYRYQ